MKEFFGGSQLSQFMDQTNPLAELTNKRRLSALGPGGLSRERAGFDVRDVHHSHYGRICPIETPEGPNIGLIGSLATYGRINELRLHRDAVPPGQADGRLGRSPSCARSRPATDLTDEGRWRSSSRPGAAIRRCRRSPSSRSRRPRPFPIRPDRDRRDRVPAGRRGGAATSSPRPTRRSTRTATSPTSASRSRYRDQFPEARPSRSTTWTSRPSRSCRVAAALIPFLEHDDANRALMGSNMQRQAVPLLEPEAPIVGTGMEVRAARDSGQVVIAARGRCRDQRHGRASPDRDRRRRARRVPRCRSSCARNQGTCINQRPIVDVGDRVARGRAARRLELDRPGRAGARPERARRLHELGGRQLRGRDRHQRAARPRRPVHVDPHREARDRGARHQARPRGDHPRHPERRRGVARATSTRTGSSTSAPRSPRATSSSARSRRRARPS